jgi:hypothetical protein
LGPSPATTAKVQIKLPSGEILPGNAQSVVAVPALQPGQTADFEAALQLPYTPPAGLAALEYLRLQVLVDPGDALAETTEANNLADTPILVQPLPVTAGLYLTVEDETYTARSGPAVPVNLGLASISGNGVDQDVAVTDYITVLSKVLPIDNSYQVAWSAAGYTAPSPASVTISRSGVDPYNILYSPNPPGNTVVLTTNRWGSLSGVIKEAGTGTALAGVSVHLTGEGLDFSVTTNTSGAFSPATDPRLSKLIPGQYSL